MRLDLVIWQWDHFLLVLLILELGELDVMFVSGKRLSITGI